MTLQELLIMTTKSHKLTRYDVDYIYFLEGIKIDNNWFDETPNPYRNYDWEYIGNSQVEVQIGKRKKILFCNGFKSYIDKVIESEGSNNLYDKLIDRKLLVTL